MDEIIKQLTNGGIDILLKIIGAAVVFIVGKFIIKKITKFLQSEKALKAVDSDAKKFIVSFINAAMYIMLFVTIVAILGVPMATIVAAVGSVGLAIGLALQGGLTNIAGGVLILIFKPFKVGDYITAAGESGTVVGIDIFYTTLMSIDNKRIVLPNSTVSGNAVTDYSANDLRRVDLKFSASYEDDVEKVKSVMLSVAAADSLVLNDPAPFARLGEHADSALIYYFRVWCKKEDYWDVYFNMNEKIKKAFDENGISIPYPQMDVHSKA